MIATLLGGIATSPIVGATLRCGAVALAIVPFLMSIRAPVNLPPHSALILDPRDQPLHQRSSWLVPRSSP